MLLRSYSFHYPCLKMEEKMSMNESELLQEVRQKITRHVNSLGDPNRATRKRGLEGIKKELFGTKLPTDTVTNLYKDLQGPLVLLVTDPVEKCRELTISLVEKYIEVTGDFGSTLPLMVPMFVQRMGQQDIVETSEELRLQLSQLATSLVQLTKKGNALYLDDYIKVLQRTLVDPYYEVRKESCKCASILAESIPQHFHQQSESLIKPLLHSISHQHSRVRLAVVNAIGICVHHYLKTMFLTKNGQLVFSPSAYLSFSYSKYHASDYTCNYICMILVVFQVRFCSMAIIRMSMMWCHIWPSVCLITLL